jgi:hypothetical protein
MVLLKKLHKEGAAHNEDMSKTPCVFVEVDETYTGGKPEKENANAGC